MELNLHPPIHIIPKFQQLHATFAQEMGLILGPLARVSTSRDRRKVEWYLVQIPSKWNEITDESGVGERDGNYLVDKLGRRRVRFGDMHSSHQLEAEALTRFAIQQWTPDDVKWICYVRKTIGGEKNIYRYPYCLEGVVYRSEGPSIRHVDAGMQNCRVWLQEHYPNWNDPLAYWDEP